jgi:hypothetical protein
MGIGLLCLTNGPFVADSQLVAALRAPAGQNGAAVLGLHALAEAVSLGPLPVIRLKSTFWHLIS